MLCVFAILIAIPLAGLILIVLSPDDSEVVESFDEWGMR